MRLRYTGQIPVSFMNLPHHGEVEPDTEFDAPDDAAESLLSRSDIQAVEDAAEQAEAASESATPARTRKAAAPKTPEASQPAVTDPTTTA